MFKKLAQQLVGWQVRKGYLQEEQQALYCYGYEALLNQMVNILAACVIAIVFHAPLPVLVFLLSYIPLRSYSGGYHAETNFVCSIVSALLTIVVCIAARWTPDVWKILLLPVGFVFSGILIFKFAPVQNKNKQLDAEEIGYYRRRSRIIWLAEVGTALICLPWIGDVSFVLAVSNLILGAMIMVGVVKNYI